MIFFIFLLSISSWAQSTDFKNKLYEFNNCIADQLINGDLKIDKVEKNCLEFAKFQINKAKVGIKVLDTKDDYSLYEVYGFEEKHKQSFISAVAKGPLRFDPNECETKIEKLALSGKEIEKKLALDEAIRLGDSDESCTIVKKEKGNYIATYSLNGFKRNSITKECEKICDPEKTNSIWVGGSDDKGFCKPCTEINGDHFQAQALVPLAVQSGGFYSRMQIYRSYSRASRNPEKNECVDDFGCDRNEEVYLDKLSNKYKCRQFCQAGKIRKGEDCELDLQYCVDTYNKIKNAMDWSDMSLVGSLTFAGCSGFEMLKISEIFKTNYMREFDKKLEECKTFLTGQLSSGGSAIFLGINWSVDMDYKNTLVKQCAPDYIKNNNMPGMNFSYETVDEERLNQNNPSAYETYRKIPYAIPVLNINPNTLGL